MLIFIVNISYLLRLNNVYFQACISFYLAHVHLLHTCSLFPLSLSTGPLPLNNPISACMLHIHTGLCTFKSRFHLWVNICKFVFLFPLFSTRSIFKVFGRVSNCLSDSETFCYFPSCFWVLVSPASLTALLSLLTVWGFDYWIFSDSI